jgi:hypothetical protein
VVLEGSLFCDTHVIPPRSPELPKWIRELPFAIGTGLACSILYDMLKYFAENTLFHDNTANAVKDMQFRLKLKGNMVIEEFAQFIEPNIADPSYANDIARALRNSGYIADLHKTPLGK